MADRVAGMDIRPHTNYTFNEMFTLSWGMLKVEWYERGPTKNFLSEFYQDCVKHGQITQDQLFWIAVIAILFTVHRYLYTKIFLNPIIKRVGFSKRDAIKFTESSCKELYYFVMCMYGHYLINYRYPEYRYNIKSHWTGVNIDTEVPLDILLLYLVECGFYFHSIYATVAMDEWKKDSIAMLLHHVLANALIIFSLSFRYHRIGLIVLYLHDIADILLEGTKLVICFKNRFPSSILEGFTMVGFLSFTFSWFWCRLWLYPQIVLFSTGYVARSILPDGNFFFFFNAMLWCLMCLNIWWFHFIVSMVIRVAMGERRIKDTRSYDEDSPVTDSGKKLKDGLAGEKGHVGNGRTNGTYKNGDLRSRK